MNSSPSTPPKLTICDDAETAEQPKRAKRPKFKRPRRPGEPNRAQRRALEKGLQCMKRGTIIPHGVMRTATPNHMLPVAIRVGMQLTLETRSEGHARATAKRYGIWAKPLDLAAAAGGQQVAA